MKQTDVDARLVLVESLGDVQNMMSWLGERRDWLAFDVETEGLNLGRDRVRLAQFGDERTAYALSYRDWRGVVAEVFRRYDRPLVAHNLIFDSGMLKRDGIVVPQHLAHDTMVMSHLENNILSVSLKGAAARHVDRRAFAGKDTLRTAMRRGKWTWATIPTDHPSYWVYSCMDTVLTARLAATLWPKIQEFREVYDLELACIHVLRDAALRGMAIDIDYCERYRDWLALELDRLRPEIPFDFRRVPGEKQIVAFLQSRGARLTKKTTKGNLAVDDEVLTALSATVPEAATILEFRQKQKLMSAYFENLLDLNTGGIVHPSVHVLGAKTGRMSVTAPALQTVPRGPVVRDAFVAREGHQFVLADFEQAELRVMAHYAKEKRMLAAFNAGEDIHTFTARECYGHEPAEEERQTAKNANFAKIYGAGVGKFAVTAGIDEATAANFLDRYDKMFPGIRRFQERMGKLVLERAAGKDRGWVSTIMGRRLFIETRKAYQGTNHLVQSSATADALKRQIVECDVAGLGDRLRLPIHDELLFETPDDIADEIEQQIREVMPERSLFAVPLEIDVKRVRRWGDAYR